MKTITLLILIILTACKTTTKSRVSDKNNVINIENTNTASTTNGQDKIIFEGENNIIDIVQKNVALFDNNHDVLIIKGSNNIIKIYNINIVDISKLSDQTLIIVGNNNKYVLLSEDQVIFTKRNIHVDSVFIKTNPIDFDSFTKDIDTNSNGYQKIKFYENQIKNGDINAYYELAEVYNYGLDNIPYNTDKAIALYEYGAVNNNIDSIRRLADIWYNGAFDKKANKTKGLYYYKLGADLNDSYCIDTLKKINGG
jgi:hypothetical protein